MSMGCSVMTHKGEVILFLNFQCSPCISLVSPLSNKSESEQKIFGKWIRNKPLWTIWQSLQETIYLNKQSNDGDSMRLPHGLINIAKQGGVPVDQMQLGEQWETGHLIT